MNEEKIKFIKEQNLNKKNANVKVCLWKDESLNACSSKIVDAHSIQRGKILSEISENGKISHFSLEPSEQMDKIECVFKKEGIKKFSTFNGFCGKHDKEIFREIEDVPFEATEKQNFIYAYRAATKELHSQMVSAKHSEILLGDKINDQCPPHLLMLPLSMVNNSPDYIKEFILEEKRCEHIRMMFKQANLSIKELEVLCKHLSSHLKGFKKSNISHLYYSFDSFYPLACSGSFIPYYCYNGNKIRGPEEIKDIALKAELKVDIQPFALINVFPENGKTHILFSLFKKGNEKYVESLEDLFENSSEADIKAALSNIILNHIENLAFNPRYINECFDEQDKSKIRKAFEGNALNPDSFIKANVNLFRDYSPGRNLKDG